MFQQELKAVADRIPYKKSCCCGFNRALETEAALDAVAPEVAVHGPQFVAIWEFGSYDDLTPSLENRFTKSLRKKLPRQWFGAEGL